VGNGPAALNPADWIQVIIALIALAAVVAAVWAARASKRAAEAGLFSTIIGQYSSPEMLEALQSLGHWHRSGTSYVGGVVYGDPVFGRGVSVSFLEDVRAWAETIWSSREPGKDAVKLDQYRRRVTYFFALAALLIEEGQLSEGFAGGFRRLLGKELYLDVVVTMELALREARRASSDDGGMKQLQQIHRVFFPGRTLPVLPPRPAT
jgi:hypothetical protein